MLWSSAAVIVASLCLAISASPVSKASEASASLFRVTENSGICETTEGVYQASGYGDLSADEHMWFWFFGARNNPDTAPLVLWLNGGPGSSSMIGLFQEHGPCRIRNDSSGVDISPISWNENANMLYLDQPIGTGFSYGTLNVSSTKQAAVDVWKFLQIFFADVRFSKYAARDFAFWTESYGGHYGPVMSAYFLDQNAAISQGAIDGTLINLKVLGIGNGITDAAIQFPQYITYAKSNPYLQLVDDETIAENNSSYWSKNGCNDAIANCQRQLTNIYACQVANLVCNPITVALIGKQDYYYVLSESPDPYPPSFSDYLESVRGTIGAETSYVQSSYDVALKFAATGDAILSSKADLEKVINAGVRTVLFAGDVDYICNYFGVEAMIDSLNTQVSSQYSSQGWSQWKVDGILSGQYKNAGNFSYVRIYGAGHEVPAYGNFLGLPTGRHALTLFTQAMNMQSIFST